MPEGIALSTWDLVASFVIGAAAASLAWAIGYWAQHRAVPVASAAGTPGLDPPDAVREAARPPPRPRPAGGDLRTSQRIVLHLSHQPRMAFGDVAPPSVTQAGMTEALGVAQPALTKVLRRLVDGGALLEMRTHVSGAPRRLKVYQLTSHGEAIARDLRRRGVAAGPAATAGRPGETASRLAGTAVGGVATDSAARRPDPPTAET